MCGRYSLNPEASGAEMEHLAAEARRRNARSGTSAPLKTSGEVFPGDRVPVICRGRSGEIGAFPMEWGYRLPDGKRLINARIETAAEKPTFRDGMRARRCLMPMSAYYEWERRGRAHAKYRIAPEGGGLNCLAGVYRFEEGRPVFAVLTMEAAEEIAFIHDRMPVVVRDCDREAWLMRGELSRTAPKWTAEPEGDVQLTLDALISAEEAEP